MCEHMELASSDEIASHTKPVNLVCSVVMRADTMAKQVLWVVPWPHPHNELYRNSPRSVVFFSTSSVTSAAPTRTTRSWGSVGVANTLLTTVLIRDWFGASVRSSILPRNTAWYSVCEEKVCTSSEERGSGTREVVGEGSVEGGEGDFEEGEDGLRGSRSSFRFSRG